MRAVALCVICAIQPVATNAASKISERYACRFDDATTQIVEIDTAGKTARVSALFDGVFRQASGPWRFRATTQTYIWKDTKPRDILAKTMLYVFDRKNNWLLVRATTLSGKDMWQGAASCAAISAGVQLEPGDDPGPV